MTWCPPAIALKWGAYFAPDADDDAKETDAAIKAHDAGLITLRAAVEKIKRPFNIENVDQFIEALEEEKAEAMKAQQQMAADMFDAGDGTEVDDGGQADEPGASTRRGPGGAARKA